MGDQERTRDHGVDAHVIQVTDEYYPEYDERERFVSGDYNSASIRDAGAIVTIGGMPDITLSPDRLVDLRDVLIAAVDLMFAESMPA